MATTSPVVTLVAGGTQTVSDPTASSGNSAVAVQIQNTSVFTITAIIGGQQFTIQSFTATTLPLYGSGGADITLTAGAGIGSPPITSPDVCYVVWLLPQANQNGFEQPPIPDGSLTSAAIAALLGTLTTSPLEAQIFANELPASGTVAFYEITLPPWANTITFAFTSSGAPGNGALVVETQNIAVQGSIVVANNQFPSNGLGLAGNSAPAAPDFGGLTYPITVFPSLSTAVNIAIRAQELNTGAAVDFSVAWGGAQFTIMASAEAYTQNVSGAVRALGQFTNAVPSNLPVGSNTSFVDLSTMSYVTPYQDNNANPGGTDTVFNPAVTPSASPGVTTQVLVPPAAGYCWELTTDIIIAAPAAGTARIDAYTFSTTGAGPGGGIQVTDTWEGATTTGPGPQNITIPVKGWRFATALFVNSDLVSGTAQTRRLSGAARMVPIAETTLRVI